MMLGLGLALPLIPIQGGTVGLSPGGDLFPDAYFAADFVGTNTVRLNGATTSLANTSGISITRATSAYYADAQGNLSQFPSGAARIGNRGLLVEGSAVNICPYSEDYTGWTFTTAAASTAITAPNGTSNGRFFVPNSGTTGRMGIILASTLGAASTATVTAFLQLTSSTLDQITIYYGNTGVLASDRVGVTVTLPGGALSDYTTGAATAPSSKTLTALAGGWYRLQFTFTTSTPDAANSLVVRYLGGTADGAKGVGVFGAQCEATAYATSYIPTTTGSATRNADVISVDGLSLGGTALTYFAEWEQPQGANANASPADLCDSAAPGNNRVSPRAIGGGYDLVDSGGASQVSQPNAGSVATAGSVSRYAFRLATNDFRACRSGTLGSADASVTLPVTLNRLSIGKLGDTGIYAGSYLRRLAIFPTAYTDAQLQAITQ